MKIYGDYTFLLDRLNVRNHSQVKITEDGTNVSEELVNYIRPLIQAELTPIMITGQPRHIVIDRQ